METLFDRSKSSYTTTRLCKATLNSQRAPVHVLVQPKKSGRARDDTSVNVICAHSNFKSCAHVISGTRLSLFLKVQLVVSHKHIYCVAYCLLQCD